MVLLTAGFTSIIRVTAQQVQSLLPRCMSHLWQGRQGCAREYSSFVDYSLKHSSALAKADFVSWQKVNSFPMKTISQTCYFN